MEGIKRYTEESIVSEVGELLDLGVKMVALFPVISPQKKSNKRWTFAKKSHISHQRGTASLSALGTRSPETPPAQALQYLPSIYLS